MIVALRDGGRAERVRLNEVGASRDEFRMDVADSIRLGKVQEVVIALNRRVPVGKTLTAKLLLGEGIFLEHGAHRAVQDQDLFPGLCFKLVDQCLVCHQAASAVAGFRPSRWQVESARFARFSV